MLGPWNPGGWYTICRCSESVIRLDVSGRQKIEFVPLFVGENGADLSIAKVLVRDNAASEWRDALVIAEDKVIETQHMRSVAIVVRPSFGRHDEFHDCRKGILGVHPEGVCQAIPMRAHHNLLRVHIQKLTSET